MLIKACQSQDGKILQGIVHLNFLRLLRRINFWDFLLASLDCIALRKWSTLKRRLTPEENKLPLRAEPHLKGRKI